MYRFFLPLLSAIFLVSCGDSDNVAVDPPQSLASGTSTSGTSTTFSTTDNAETNALALQSQIDIANGFCVNQKKLQIISTSLLSAYAPKGNGSDLNYCGGENVFTENGPDFSLQLSNYCVEARGQQVRLNGAISGSTESGSNFISSIIENLSIVGADLDWDLSGNTWDGRASDNFMNLQVTDNINTTTLQLNDVSIKKGELDFGQISFDGLNPVSFQFITHFNAENTEGLLFIYGEGDEKLIISGDNGMITAVYTKDRHDDGTWLDLPCNN